MAKYFVTGGSGFVGTQVVKQLIEEGDQVLALARSDASAKKLKDLGAEVVKGSLEDLDVLKKAVVTTDGVIHLGFIHDFSNYENSCKVDRAAVEAFADALEGSNKVLITTSGTLVLAAPLGSPPSDEFSATSSDFGQERTDTETFNLSLKNRGIRSSSVRLSPTVHGKGDHGFIPGLIDLAEKNGVVAYVGEGLNEWSAVHLKDAANLFVLVARKGVAGSVYHGVAEEGVKAVDISKAIGKKLNLPTKSITSEEAGKYLSFLGFVFAINAPSSGEFTQKSLGWTPKHIGLLEDIDENYQNGNKEGFVYD